MLRCTWPPGTKLASLAKAFDFALWRPREHLGYAYVYDENGTLIAEVGSGGANSAGQAQYIYLPTVNGPVPVAAVTRGASSTSSGPIMAARSASRR